MSLREFVERFEEELPRALRAVRLVEGVETLLHDAEEHLTRGELTEAEGAIKRSILELQVVEEHIGILKKRLATV